MKSFIVKALVLFALLFAMPTEAATLLPNGQQVFLDNNGAPLSGGTVTFYIPGTTVLKTTWQDSGQTIANTNPVVLDAAGRALVYGSGTYRQIVKDSLGNTIWDRLTSDTASSSFSWGGTSTGSGNAQSVTASNFSSQDGQIIGFIAGFTNTTAMTIIPNGASPIAVVKDTTAGAVALTGGEVTATNSVQVVYDATAGVFHLVSTPPPSNLIVSGTVQLTGTITPTTLLSSTNDWNPTGFSTATIVRMSASSPVNLTGLTARLTGTIVSLQNVGSNAITAVAASSSSIAANRFNLASNIVIGGNQSLMLQYDGTTANWRVFDNTFPIQTPNVQVFTSGSSLTYTTPASVLYLRVRMCGGGGGGGAANTNAGGNGGDTAFGSWTAIHGTGGGTSSGSNGGTGGAGGTGGVNGSGTQITRVDGGAGMDADNANAGADFGTKNGGAGASSFFGGAGKNTNSSTGAAAKTNTCSGGGGARNGGGNVAGGAGGGAGEYVEFIVPAPAATYTYTVGAAGTGGAAGGAAGGAGGAGRIEVIAHYQ